MISGDKTELLNNGSIARLLSVQMSEQARYTCQAVNKIGQAEADTFVSIKSEALLHFQQYHNIPKFSTTNNRAGRINRKSSHRRWKDNPL
jgi:hypothetical protein